MVVAGGSGTRLWPRSRRQLPKHLLPLAPDRRSLLRHAFERGARLGGPVLVVTARSQAALVRGELPELEPGNLLLEPEPRGTGPALAWAALRALELRPGAVMVSLHADHYMPQEEATSRALLSAARWASLAPVLISIGVRPTWPAPGLGYVEAGEALAAPPGLGPALPLHRGLRFVEKPGVERAREMLDRGGYLWNTGLFSWSAELFLEELGAHAPAVRRGVERARAALSSGAEAFGAAWSAVPSGVVDRLVMERTARLAALPVALAWSDLGSFADLRLADLEAGLADREGNVSHGDVLLLGSRESYVDSAGGRLVVLVGGQQLAVVDSGDALLVCPLERVQDVAQVVAELRQRGRAELL